jgi:hypothetical protein
MKMADVLHTIADLLDKVEDDKPAQAPVVVNVNAGGAQPAHDAGEHGEPELQDKPTMVPPLQQKLEIMKKMAGMPHHLTAVAADDDEPFEG